MTDGELPPPLVPPEVDLRDFQGMWVDTDRLLRSDTWLEGTGDQKAAAFTLWAESWHQVPAASLPDSDRLLAKLSQADNWGRAKGHALRGWIRCADGRLYHPVVAEKALEGWIEKLTSAITGATGNAKRWQIKIETTAMREQLRTAVDALRKLDPASRALKKRAVMLILAESGPDAQGDIGHESGGDIGGRSPKDRKGPDLTGPDQNGLDLFGVSAPAPTPDPKPERAAPRAERAAAPPPAPPFDGLNGEPLKESALVPLASNFELPENWGTAAEALGFTPKQAAIEGEKFRQYWVEGAGKGKRRTVKGWRQAWSNWLGKAAQRWQR